MGERTFYFILAVLVAGLALRQPALVLLASLLLVGGGMAWLWGRYSLDRVEYVREFPQRRAAWGEEVEFVVRVSNNKLLPLPWLEIDDEIPLKLEPVNFRAEQSHLVGVALLSRNTSLRWYERTTWRYRVRCTARGYHKVGPVTLCSGDLTGLFRRCRRDESFDRLLVYPRVFSLARLALPARQPFGELKGSERIYEDPVRLAGTRDYRPNDPLKRIDWKATARRMALQVRVYEPSTTYQLVIFLNVATLPYSWQGHVPERLEAVVSAAASMAAYAQERGYAVGLYANGTLPDSRRGVRVPPGRDPTHLALILEALAMITPFTYNNIETILSREAHHLPWGATVVLITALVTDAMLEILTRLRGLGHRLIVLTLDPVALHHHLTGVTIHRLADVAEFEGESPLPRQD